ncbi:MAG: hypothetical protein GWN00_22055 [Aliifodinibius sp.]|nr:hypothetical protein [Phycisphaerae bacterium]NIT58805.1 hypothetical protein [Fodinibius sp.]NIV13650.1 hypothetical protein [Fodinibius sp.]NIY27388.1 hypothetical protein [Fodinibius sp.]
MLKIPKTIKNQICSFVFVVVLLIVSDLCVGGTVVNNKVAARASKLKDLLGSLEGERTKEAPRIFKTPEGHLRFLGSPPSTHFPVDPKKRSTPQEAADAFLAKNRNLFVSDSPSIGFNIFKVNTRNSRTYIRYQQMYGGLKVFGAEMVVKVNASGGIEAVMSDIIRDTKALEPDEFWQDMIIDDLTAQDKAIEWMAAKHPQLKFQASDPELMIFDPPVVGWKGPKRLVWHIDVTNVGELEAQQYIMLDANDATVVFHYSRISYALNRKVKDDETDTWYYEEDYPTEVEEVDLAFEYLEDTWWFFKNHHDREGYGGGDEDTVAWVNYDGSTGWWFTHMRLEAGHAIDDLIAHEFAHGVSDTNPCDLKYTFNEAGAINEVFSDIWGEFVDQENLVSKTGNDQSEDKWLLFEDLSGGAWRDMKDPPSSDHGPAPAILYGDYWYPLDYDGDCNEAPAGRSEPPAYYCFTHRNNGVGNKLCYLLTDGDTFNGHTVTAMDINDVSDLFYETQYILTSQCDYYDLYNALTDAAIDVNMTQAQRDNIEQACQAVEICPTKDLVGWWKFDETTGYTAYDSVFDNDGGVEGATWTSGKIDGALDFDGTNDYVELEYFVNALRTSSVTISAWVKRNITTNTRLPIVSTYDYQYSSDWGYLLYVKKTAEPAYYEPIFKFCGASVESNISINTTDWYHIAGTYDNEKLKIYINGVLKNTNTQSDLTDFWGNYDSTFIGYEDDNNYTGYFDGLIDDVRVYRKPLGMFEIWDAMSGDLPRFRIKNSDDETVAWFDDYGNLFLKGTFTSGGSQTRPTTSTDDEFVLKDSIGNLMVINTTNGNMNILGEKHEDVVMSGQSPEGFIIKNSDGDVVAYIDDSGPSTELGHLYLAGKLYDKP